MILHINEFCVPYIESSNLLMELSAKITSNLYGLEKSINSAIDFNVKRKRPVIKFGLDKQLDAKKLKLQDIVKNVTTAANIAVDNLPNYIDSCTVVHVPEVGYLVSIEEWEPNCNIEQFSDLGYQFMVMSNKKRLLGFLFRISGSNFHGIFFNSTYGIFYIQIK